MSYNNSRSRYNDEFIFFQLDCKCICNHCDRRVGEGHTPMKEEEERRKFKISGERNRELVARNNEPIDRTHPKAIVGYDDNNTITRGEITSTATTTEQNATSSIPSPIQEQIDNKEEEEEEREAEVSSKEMREWRRSVANKNKIRYYVESDEIDSDKLDNF